MPRQRKTMKNHGWRTEPIESIRDRKTIVSISTPEDQTEEVDRAMQAKMDGQVVLDAMETKHKVVKSLKILSNGLNLDGQKLVIDSHKLSNQVIFNRLIILSMREVKTKQALRFELTPTPMSLFDNDHMLRKPNKAALARFLNAFVESIKQPPCTSLVIDGGWLLHYVSWEANVTWKEIAESYLQFVKSIGSHCLRITVVFDGYSSSTKDHEHLRRYWQTKNECCDIMIHPDLKCTVPRETFLNNKSNKAQLILLLAEAFGRNDISVLQCPSDADTAIVREALDEARDSTVEVRTEDTDVMVMLIHHVADHSIFLTAKDVSYNVGKVQNALPDRYRKYLLFLHRFSGCDTVSAILGFEKSTLLTRLCKTDKVERAMDMFLDIQSKRDDIIKAGSELFKFLFYGKPHEDLEDLRFDIFNRQATTGKSKKTEKLNLPPTTGAAAQHSLRAYLQTRDWLELRSPSLDVLDYGWKLSDKGYEPVPSTDPIAPDYLLRQLQL